MPSIRVDRTLKDQTYFVTLTVKNWYYLFDRHDRFRILSDSLNFARETKGLRLYAYVLMLNHLHLVGQAEDMGAIMRDFKRHTTKELIANIRAFEPTIERLFLEEGGTHQVWQPTNLPKQIMTGEYLEQKIAYVENNPVRKQYVAEPGHWIYSSANPNSPVGMDPIDFV